MRFGDSMKNNDLYSTVKRIIDCSSIKESEELLYGIEGVNINPKVYYERILTEFGIRKEEIIDSRERKLCFDLKKHKKEIWQLIFLSEKLYEAASNKEDIDNLNPSDFVSIENVDESVSDDECLEKLRLAICMIHKLKNSTKHNKDNSYSFSDDEECELIINNTEGNIKLQSSLPLRYIKGFNEGSIIPLAKDREIASKVDEVVYPLLEKLNYDPKKLTNFFYRVNPELMSYLLEKVNNNVEELYKLPVNVFRHHRKIETLQVFFDRGYSINDLKKLQNFEIYQIENTCDLLDMYGVDFVAKLPKSVHYYKESIIKLVNLIGKENVEQITNTEAFENAEFTSWLLKNYGIEQVNLLPVNTFCCITPRNLANILIKYNLDIYDIKSFYENKMLIEFDKLIKLLDLSENPKLLTKFPDIGFIKFEKIRSIIDRYSLAVAVNFHPDIFAYQKEACKLIDSLGKKNIGLAKYLNKYAIQNPKNTLAIFKMFKYDEKFISKLPEYVYSDVDSFKKIYKVCNNLDLLYKGFVNDSKYMVNLLELFKKFNNNSEEIKQLPKKAFEDPLKFMKLLEVCNDDIDLIKKLPSGFYDIYNISTTLKLIDVMGLDNVLKLPGYASNLKALDFYRVFQDIDIVKELPEEYFYREERLNINNIKLLLEDAGEFKEKISQYPYELFCCPSDIFKEMYAKYNANLAKSIFGLQNPKMIALIVYMNKALAKFDRKKEQENALVYTTLGYNYPKFKEDIECMDGFFNLFEKENISKEEFKKIIGALKRNKERLIGNKFFISDMNKYIESIIYRESSIDDMSEKALAGCWKGVKSGAKGLYDKYQLKIGVNMVHEISAIRNACSHFRFEGTKDEKIRVWDMKNTGELEYNEVFELGELCDFAHNVEGLLEGKSHKNIVDHSIKQK